MATKKFSRGTTLIGEGEKTNSIFILINGRIGIYKGSVLISEFAERGVVVGEMAAILGEKRTATIRALEDTYVVEFKTGIDALIAEYPDIAKKIMINLAERLKRTTQEYWFITTDMNQRMMDQIKEEEKELTNEVKTTAPQLP